jgi:hypothetical protein
VDSGNVGTDSVTVDRRYQKMRLLTF